MTPPALTSGITIDEIVENFSLLEDWEDRYGYLIELGRDLSPLTEDEMNEANKVRGCVSQVWLVPHTSEDTINPEVSFRGASDAHIVSGLVAIALAIFSGKLAADIAEIDETLIFNEIGLQEHLTPQRSNGLRSMVKRIKEIADAVQKT